MPSALETLVKILRLEREQGFKNSAVIGGLGAFATNWQDDAHAQARKPEHHDLVDELVDLMREYETLDNVQARHEAIKYMMGRITGKIPPREDRALAARPAEPPPESRPPQVQPPGPESESPAAPAETEAESPPAPEQKRSRKVGRASTRRVVEKVRGRRSARRHQADEARDVPEEAAVVEGEAPPEPEPEAEAVHPKPRRKVRRVSDLTRELDLLHGLDAPVTVIEGVGEKMAEKFARLGVQTVGDLLYHVPRRHDDYTRLVPIHRAQPGESLTLIGTVRSSKVLKGRSGRPYLQVVMDDGTASLMVFFFGQPYLQHEIKKGEQLVVSGKVEQYLGRLSMNNPDWELLEYDNLHTRAIVPVYPLTEGLTARTMRRIMKATVDYWAPRLPDYLPDSVLDRAELVDLGWALKQVHFPDNWDYYSYAVERLAFDELFLLQMAMLARRRAWQKVPGMPLPVTDQWVERLAANLPYALTDAQRRALDEIRRDMAVAVPMNRLLQGDVGSGKTVVAALAMLMAVENGAQAALMAPTSILAEQHFRSLTALFAQLMPDREIAVRLLTGATPAAEREDILRRLADGTVSVVVGTHALIQPDVDFANLALAVVDEQHRFGVAQRAQLRGKGTNPHVLVMTATPIPRTLALTLHADLDLSIIDEMPPGRTPVKTYLLTERERERAYSFIDHQVEQGRQAFIVYPLVEAETPDDEAQAAVDEYARLQQEIFPNRRLGLLHGRLSSEEKDAVMARFQAGELDILVSTSVVEVGIDVPNASVILIEGANRFGLAQLHQFRGRVGRGAHESYCLLIGDTSTGNAQQRLEAMVRTNDGFELAELDYQLRGAGELFGTRQSGLDMRFRFGGAFTPALVALAQREARTLYEEDPDLTLPEHRLLAERVAMWRSTQTDLS
ncbi:MAG: hypothetical protein Kow0077_31130 [Anaerolineae bacterium]